MKSNVRAPVRGGSLPNRKAKYAKISREPIAKENTETSLKTNSTDLDEKKYANNLSKQVLEPSPKCENSKENGPTFITARQQLLIDSQKKVGQSASPYAKSEVVKKSLGSRGPRMAFVPPFARSKDENQQSQPTNSGAAATAPQPMCPSTNDNTIIDERLKQFDQKIIDLIMSEIMDSDTKITWDDIAGLHSVKATLKEVVVFPMLRPDIFTGLRGPPKGLLLFGPPGTGKTLIGKCIASISKSTFFSISASSLTSKWVGDGEKMVRALFTIARMHAPAVIFIDEVDSLLSQRSETEHESSRRIKTEFLVQLDGVSTGSEERLLLIGATNRPQELDEAARRRFVKRLYVPLPCEDARREIVGRLIKQQKHSLTPDDLDIIAAKSEGFSGADVANLCREAAMGPIRGLPLEVIESISAQDVPSVGMSDFLAAFRHVKASVSPNDLKQYISWNQQYGSFQI
nr:fidgetin protein 1 [Hymenolepis microstoma]